MGQDLSFYEKKFNDSSTTADQLVRFAEGLFDETVRICDRYIELDKKLGVQAAKPVLETCERLRKDLAAVGSRDAVHKVALNALKNARDAEMLLLMYY
ncbi:MAG: hypothetical protein KF773_12335 [Deltaproteobacteria bacterium]|nr:hypothetical protein [Deltaproteobacteria bacterium]